MTARNYDVILAVNNAIGFEAGNSIIGISSRTEAQIANVDLIGNTIKVKQSNLLQEFHVGELIHSNTIPNTAQNVSVEFSNSSVTIVSGNTFIIDGNTNTFPIAIDSKLTTNKNGILIRANNDQQVSSNEYFFPSVFHFLEQQEANAFLIQNVGIGYNPTDNLIASGGSVLSPTTFNIDNVAANSIIIINNLSEPTANAGTGYSPGDRVEMTGGIFTTNANVDVSNVSSVSAIVVTGGGSDPLVNYTTDNIFIVDGGVGASNAWISPSNVQIDSTNVPHIVSVGSNYDVGDTLTVLGGEANPNATFSVDNVLINNASVTNIGLNYIVDDVLTIVGGTSHDVAATFNIASVNAAQVTSDLPGKSYFPTETLTIVGGIFSKAATIEVATVLAVDGDLRDAPLFGLNYLPADQLNVLGGTAATNATANVRSVGVGGSFAAQTVSAGTGYLVDDVINLAGGTSFSEASINVTSIGGSGEITGFIGNTRGSYTVIYANGGATTGGTGSGATFDVAWGVRTAVINTAGDYSTVPINPTPTSSITGTGSNANLNVQFGILTHTTNSTGNYSIVPSNAVSVSGGSGSGATFNIDYGIGILVANTFSDYTVQPTNPVSTTGGSDTGATLTVNWGINAISLVTAGDYANSTIENRFLDNGTTSDAVLAPHYNVAFLAVQGISPGKASNGGGDYSTVPANPATLISEDKPSASITATVDYGIKFATITEVGDYTTIPSNPVTVTGDGNDDATPSIFFDLKTISLNDLGEYNTVPSNIVVFTTNGSGTGATANINFNNITMNLNARGITFKQDVSAQTASLQIQSVSGEIASCPFTAAYADDAVLTANASIISITPSPYIAEKNAFTQNPIVRLYSLYYPGEWFPINSNGNPTLDGAGLSWPTDFPFRFAEVRGDIISDLQYDVQFAGIKYTPYPIDSSGIALDSSGKINEVTLTISNFDNVITTLVENPFLVGNNNANAVTATVNSELVSNIDPRTVPGNPLFDSEVVAASGGNNVAFDYLTTQEVAGHWTRLKQDTRDLLGAVVEIRSTFANFLDVWPEYSSVRSLFGDSVEVYSSLPYRPGDIVKGNNTSGNATVLAIKGSVIITNNNSFTDGLAFGDRLYIENQEADSENFVLDSFKVDNLNTLTETAADFALTSWLQFFKLRLPRRRFLKNTCPWSYKGDECQYADNGTGPIFNTNKTANGFFTIQNATATNIAQDVCAHNLLACELRNNEVNFGGFPATGRTIPR